MTNFSGAGDEIDFDGYTRLLQCENNKYVYSSGLEIFKFKTDDINIDYIFLMDKNMIPYPFAVGEKYTYFFSPHYKFIPYDKIEEGTLLNATNDSSDSFDYHLGKCCVDSFKTLEHSQTHTFPHMMKKTKRMKMLIWLKQIIVIGTMKCFKFLIKNVLYVMKEIVSMLLDNVVISVFVKSVIKIEVILIY